MEHEVDISVASQKTVIHDDNGKLQDQSSMTGKDENVVNEQGGNSNLVDFDGPDDPANPVNWSTSYKWTAVFLVSVMTLVVYVVHLTYYWTWC